MTLKDGISLRGVSRGIQSFFSIIFPKFKSWIPSCTTINRWIKRIGLYKLNKPLEQASDWIAIADASISIGTQKVVMVLGIRLATFKNLTAIGQPLRLQDVEPLHMKIVESCNKLVIYDALQQAEARIGKFCQICIDGGSDMQAGSRLFVEEILKKQERKIHVTYDTPHKVACFYKALLENDPKFLQLTAKATITSQKYRQSKFSFLIPPSQRSKARFMNLNELVIWADRTLMVLDMQEHLRSKTLAVVGKKAAAFTFTGESSITNLANQETKNKWQINNPSKECMAKEVKYAKNADTEKFDMTVPLSDEDYKELLEGFGWLREMRKDIQQLSEYVLVGMTVRNEVRIRGLHVGTYQELDKKLDELPLKCQSSYELCGKCLDFIQEQTEGLKEGDLLLGSDEVIESLYGKMKVLLNEDVKQGLTSFVLAASAVCGDLDEDVIRNAFSTTTDENVTAWSQQNLGRTHISKRRRCYKFAKMLIGRVKAIETVIHRAGEVPGILGFSARQLSATVPVFLPIFRAITLISLNPGQKMTGSSEEDGRAA